MFVLNADPAHTSVLHSAARSEAATVRHAESTYFCSAPMRSLRRIQNCDSTSETTAISVSFVLSRRVWSGCGRGSGGRERVQRQERNKATQDE
jgi:hypothetical protein